MSLPDEYPAGKFIEIPEIFCSSETGKPFEHCLMCNRSLLEDNVAYMVEKMFKQHEEFKIKEVVFEYALCMECAIKMNQSMSEESRQRVAAYFEQHANLMGRAELLSRESFDITPWINKCFVKNTPIAESAEYQLVAECRGKSLLFTYMPFALSMEAMSEVTALLSAKSLGEMDNFIGKYFTGPPEVAELLKRRLVLI